MGSHCSRDCSFCLGAGDGHRMNILSVVGEEEEEEEEEEGYNGGTSYLYVMW